MGGSHIPDVLDQEVQTVREDVSSVFENLCRDSVGSSAFVILQPCNGLPEFRVKRWGVSRCMVGGRSGRLSRIYGSAGLVWLKSLPGSGFLAPFAPTRCSP